MKTTLKKVILGIVISVLLACTLTGCTADKKEIQSLEEIKNVRFGILTGSLAENIYQESFSDCEAYYFDTTPDLIAALSSDKIDCFPLDELEIESAMESTDNIRAIGESLYDQELAAIFKKDSPRSEELRTQFDTFLEELKESGELEELKNNWNDHYNDLEIDFENYSGENGVVRFASSFDIVPFSFISNGKPSGFELDLVARFCRKYGYQPEISNITFGALITAVVTEKADFAMDAIAVTEERRQSVDFSKPYDYSGMFMMVRKQAEKKGFLESIKDGFEKTFIQEGRWKMLLSGLLTTLAITFSSMIIGSVLGFGVYLLSRNRKKLATVFDGIAWVFGNLPTVLLLMVMFYIVFGKTNFNGFTVSIIAFSLSVTFSVYSAMASAVKAVDYGQTEGGYSLGFTDIETFMKIIFPQAMGQFLPNYSGILTGLVQATAVVGYIAVEDLTKVSDIIRSRTYEAFFPLIASALIYLLVSYLLTRLIKTAEKKMTPSKRSAEIVKRRFSK